MNDHEKRAITMGILAGIIGRLIGDILWDAWKKLMGEGS